MPRRSSPPFFQEPRPRFSVQRLHKCSMGFEPRFSYYFKPPPPDQNFEVEVSTDSNIFILYQLQTYNVSGLKEKARVYDDAQILCSLFSRPTVNGPYYDETNSKIYKILY